MILAQNDLYIEYILYCASIELDSMEYIEINIYLVVIIFTAIYYSMRLYSV